MDRQVPLFAFSSLCRTSFPAQAQFIKIPACPLDLPLIRMLIFSDKLRYNEAKEMSPTDVWMTAPGASRSLHSVLFPSRHTWSVSIFPKCLALLKAVMWRTVPTSCEWSVISLEGNIGNYGGGGKRKSLRETWSSFFILCNIDRCSGLVGRW